MFASFDNDLKIVSSWHKEVKPYGKIESRLYHGFLFRIKGAVRYDFIEKTLVLNAGEIIFLPQGVEYEYSAIGEDSHLYTSINFQGELKDPTPKVYPFDVYHGTNYIVQSFSELWNFGSATEKYKCLSLFYDFLSHVINFDSLNSEDKLKHRLIEPAAEYLKQHVYDADLKISKLHQLCGISNTYFRKIFTSKYGMNPKEYLLTERISHAKTIIENGDYGSIREISEAIGYNDPLYFSKAFKKIHGLSPTAYEKRLMNE